MRILFVAYLWKGAKDWSYKEALERLGHEVVPFDIYQFFPNMSGKRPSIVTRLLNRALYPVRAWRVNRALVAEAVRLNAELILTMKCKELSPGTLREIKRLTTSVLFNISTDDIYSPRHPSNTSRWLKESVGLYHCIFTNKPWALRKEMVDRGAQRSEYLQFAFDPLVNRPVTVSEEERKSLAADVVFVGSPEAERIEVLEAIAAQGFDLKVYGPDWHKFDLSPALKKCVTGKPLYQHDLAKLYSVAKIALVFVRHGDRDLTNTRVFETPACGAFMLSERNLEITRFYEEGKEAACFGSPEEACKKIAHYLAHEDERKKIAAAGHARVLSFGYNFDSRATRILEVFNEMWYTDTIVAANTKVE
jgi:spore maturation protein CgeB